VRSPLAIVALAAAPLAGSAHAALVPAGAGLSAPADIRADVWARVANPTAFAVDARGRLWATTSPRPPRPDGSVVVVTRQGKPPTPVVTGISRPLGLAWRGDELFVSSFGRVDAYSGLRGFRFRRHRTVLTGLPAGTGPAHQNDGLAVGPGGRIWLGIGALCNACAPTAALEASIVSFLPSGRGLRVEARGLRNPYGLAFVPGTNVLLATENGRDDLGPGAPPDELNRIVPGRSYGHPDCWGQGGPACADVEQPVVGFAAHASADGLAVLAGGWGPRYGTSAFVAEFGSTAQPPTGHDVVRVALHHRPDGTWTGRATTFATGFTNPLAVAVSPRGLFVGDWTAGVVYRLRPRVAPR
jgi:glucose/arabinose dehydrogenase